MSYSLRNIIGEKYTPGKWKYPPMDGTFLIMKEGVPPWPYDTNEEELLMAMRSRSHARKQGRQLKLRKYPALGFPGSEDGNAKKPKCSFNDQDDLCKPYEGSSSGREVEEPKIATPFHKSPSDPGLKAEESTADTYPLLKLPSSTGTKAEEPKIATPFDKSSSNPGMKAEEPNVDTSPLLKLPSSTGNQDNAAGLVTSIFESAAHRRSMCQIQPELRRGKCKVCSLVDDHPTTQCPYLDFLPEDATVSSGCDLICNFCSKLNGNCKCWKEQGQHVDLKFCVLCSKLGEHWATLCPLQGSRQT